MARQTRRSSIRWRRGSVLVITLLLTGALSLSAQTSSGTVVGRVVDAQRDPVPGAIVTLTKPDTRETRTFTTDSTGEFVFASIQPGVYDVTVDLQGFKRVEKRGLSLSASDRLSAGDLQLEVGGVSESVEVRATVSPVQSVSSERSALLDSNQVENLMSRGRDVMALLAILPGVVDEDEGSDALGVFNSPQSVSGTRGIYSGMNIDGVSGNVRSGDHIDNPVNMDAVAEVKVLMNSYQAEYGKGSGAIINVVSKTGTRTFHGATYDYIRHDRFNANSFFRTARAFQRASTATTRSARMSAARCPSGGSTPVGTSCSFSPRRKRCTTCSRTDRATTRCRRRPNGAAIFLNRSTSAACDRSR